MKEYPFPDEVSAREELKRDVLYHCIPEEDRLKICAQAWNRGKEFARKIMCMAPEKSIREIAEAEGVRVIISEKDQVNGAIRTYGEYKAEKNEMILYTGSIVRWARVNHMEEQQAMELVMAHEFYHYAECRKIGFTSDLYIIPVLKIGKKVLRKSGIRALSEIGAHGFACTYMERRLGKTWNR